VYGGFGCLANTAEHHCKEGHGEEDAEDGAEKHSASNSLVAKHFSQFFFEDDEGPFHDGFSPDL
jgi:hypothetical protein